MTLQLVTGYAGSNPQDPALVERLGDASFRVCPESEDGDSNYKFAFDVTVRNESGVPQALALTVDWQEPPDVGTTYMAPRVSVFVIGPDTWQEVTGRLDGDKVHFELEVPPGDTRVCLHPPFWTDELDAFFEQASVLPGAKHVTYGRTAEGRSLEAAWLPATDGIERTVLAIGRIHPYETAGSFFVAGILELLASPPGEELRRNTSFLLAPLVNPDGVAHGLCKRTTTGTELSTQGVTSNDPAAAGLHGLIAGVAAGPRPVLIDAHGWMIEEDGPIFYTTDLAGRMLSGLDPDLFPKGFRVKNYIGRPPDPDTTDLRRYAVEQLGIEVFVTSHPWFGRRPATLRRIGAEFTRSFLAALA